MRHRVEDRQLVVRDVHAVDRTIRVDAGVSLVGRDLIVHVVDLGAPFPQRDDDVALDTLRAWRRRRHGARGNPVTPAGEHLQAPLAAEPAHDVGHLRPALPHLHPMVPGGQCRVELFEVVDLADDAVSQLVAEHAALLLDVDPLPLMLQVGRDAIPVRSGAGELARRRRLDQGIPVVGRVNPSRFGRCGRHGGLDVEGRARLGGDTGRIEQAVAADPDLVAGLGEVGNQVAATVTGHHALDELGRQVGRFGDDPHALFRSVRARDGAADVTLCGPSRCREPDE